MTSSSASIPKRLIMMVRNETMAFFIPSKAMGTFWLKTGDGSVVVVSSVLVASVVVVDVVVAFVVVV